MGFLAVRTTFGIMLAIMMTTMLPCIAFGAHPLITDDTGTQGKGKFQIEVNGQYDSDKETIDGVSIKSPGGDVVMTLSYGVTDSADIVLNLPYVWSSEKEDGVTVYDEKGFSDMSFEVKWRFLEKNGFSFGIKPGVSFPTANDEKGLGRGKTGYHLFLIGTKEAVPWAFHANLGYIRHENKADEDKNLWHASFATTCEIVKNLKLVGNIGMEKNPDRAAHNDPVFLIAGAIYSISDDFDIDAGVKYGLTSTETDLSLMVGMAIRF